MDDDNLPASYTWEKAERSWESLEEDASGMLKLGATEKARIHRVTQLETSVWRGLVRYLVLCIDRSANMEAMDVKPNRHAFVTKMTTTFIKDYFDQNPISRLAIVTTRNALPVCLSPLAGNADRHVKALEERPTRPSEPICAGEPSLQNSLLMAREMLQDVPTYGFKEILVLWGSLRTCDPGDILATIDQIKQPTAAPPTANGGKLTGGTVPNMIRVGFPRRATDMRPTLCVCHRSMHPVTQTDAPAGGSASAASTHTAATTTFYVCPRCSSRYCSLPVDCQVCGLTLMAAPHLARSYHHLVPLPPFVDTTSEDPQLLRSVADFPRLQAVAAQASHCEACLIPFKPLVPRHQPPQGSPPARAAGGPDGLATALGGLKVGPAVRELRLVCPKCTSVFCSDCDLFIHDSLHNCPGCECKPLLRRSGALPQTHMPPATITIDEDEDAAPAGAPPAVVAPVPQRPAPIVTNPHARYTVTPPSPPQPPPPTQPQDALMPMRVAADGVITLDDEGVDGPQPPQPEAMPPQQPLPSVPDATSYQAPPQGGADDDEIIELD
ncbi:putative General transcription factor IIH subunit 2 [Paratrimastix pyriformis]|uniref:General transcription factor IIH subunit 2 n=1 Tax=Paratrimastix pyriformis TaxID=342808 RepID=A0ABQ8UCK0_9EUKA|nr:putative General transcription factor IIH subunit 2 [Paratrimastix pyriformis]